MQMLKIDINNRLMRPINDPKYLVRILERAAFEVSAERQVVGSIYDNIVYVSAETGIQEEKLEFAVDTDLPMSYFSYPEQYILESLAASTLEKRKQYARDFLKKTKAIFVNKWWRIPVKNPKTHFDKVAMKKGGYAIGKDVAAAVAFLADVQDNKPVMQMAREVLRDIGAYYDEPADKWML